MVFTLYAVTFVIQLWLWMMMLDNYVKRHNQGKKAILNRIDAKAYGREVQDQEYLPSEQH